MPSSVVWRRPLPASYWVSGGCWCEVKCAKTSVGKANGRPRRMYCMAA